MRNSAILTICSVGEIVGQNVLKPQMHCNEQNVV
jgi:hypothetical protein